MTVSNTTARWSYTGDAVTTAFAYTSKIFASSDLQVYLDGVLQGGGYTVSNVGSDSGGNVTFSVAPGSSVVIVIAKNVPLTQPSDYPNAGVFPAETAEDDLDRAAVRDAQLFALIQRCLRLADTDSQLTIGTLPAKANRTGGKVLGFDTVTGDPVAIAYAIGTTGVTAFMATVLDDADAAAARATLGLDLVAGLTVGYVDALAAEGPVVDFFRDSASAAVDDYIGALAFTGRNSTGAKRTYAKVGGKIVNPTNLSEAGKLVFSTMESGVQLERAELRRGLIMGSPTGGDQGQGTLNVQIGLFRNGVAAAQLELLSSQSPAAVATVDFANLLTSAYKHYVLVGTLRPATDDVNLLLRTSTDGGASYDAGASDYKSAGNGAVNGAVSFTGSNGATAITIAGAGAGFAVGSDADQHVSFEIAILRPSETGQMKLIHFRTGWEQANDAGFAMINGAGCRVATADIDSIRLLFSSGNITSGRVILYGVRDG